eukprot:m.79889 g.79889  ORF g.79889 m.79889 type:complete len:92 (+) comp10851_c0_seq3:2585-2860(+)
MAVHLDGRPESKALVGSYSPRFTVFVLIDPRCSFGLQKYEEPMVYLLTQDSEASRLPPTILQPYVVRDVTEDGSYSSVSLSRLDVSAELLN